mgnify:CR=1 FL=1
MPNRLTPPELNSFIATNILGVKKGSLERYTDCLPYFPGQIESNNIRFALHPPVSINNKGPNSSRTDIRIGTEENMIFVPINNGTNGHFSLLTLIKNEEKEVSYNAYLLDPQTLHHRDRAGDRKYSHVSWSA